MLFSVTYQNNLFLKKKINKNLKSNIIKLKLKTKLNI